MKLSAPQLTYRNAAVAVLSFAAIATPITPLSIASAAVIQEEGFTLGFVDADVRRVADAVFGSMLEVDYDVDPAVQGNVTLRTVRPVGPDELIRLFENALRPLDAVILREGYRYRLLPRSVARSVAPLGGEGASTAGFASETIKVSQGDVEAIAKLISEVAGEGSVAATDVARGEIIVVGDANQRANARRIAERFDISALSGMTFEMVRLSAVEPETVAAELRQVFQPPYDIIDKRVRLVPMPRLDSLLVIASNDADIATVLEWVDRFDSGAAGKRRLYNYDVQNGRATDMARTLQLVLGVGDSAVAAMPAPRRIADAEEALGAPELPAIVPGRSGSARIVPNEATNSLLIYADGAEYSFIEEALEQLDRPVPQVLIEAVLAEVTLTEDFEFGLDFNALLGDFNIISNSGTSLLPAPRLPGLSIGYERSRASAVLNAIDAKTDVRVLSAPKLIVLNNQTATLQVGDQVPVITSQVQGVTAPGAPIVNNVELKDTGVILEVTPRVNESGVVTFDIIQEVSDVAETTSSGINSPTIQQRRVATTVTTTSGQMIALGGLIRHRGVVTKSGIPVLSQIPLFGGLFGSRREDEAHTELIILLTPTVLRNAGQVGEAVDQLILAVDDAIPLIEQGMETQVRRGDAAAR
ncbi:secretin N-terminal domain-containing protein [Sphingomicrobium arenosum]|uniref:secretin N-terminal domain-containing protein n=1 Tax=Sphingomicrobium arenosum TaxID=2233861 RepID=UPI002240FAF3|nr:secretin N-terminal domain-containing protein [Sphingomicrobium arenosum]